MPSKAFQRIKQGLEEAIEYAKGNTPPGTRVHRVPVGNVDVAKLRAKLGLSQADFAQGFGVPKATVQNWEQGRRNPQGPAHVLLTIIDRDPEHVIKLLWPQAAKNSGRVFARMKVFKKVKIQRARVSPPAGTTAGDAPPPPPAGRRP